MYSHSWARWKSAGKGLRTRPAIFHPADQPSQPRRKRTGRPVIFLLLDYSPTPYTIALMALLPPNHFLALPRPDVPIGPPAGVVDTTTLAAHDFDVDTRTGFMPPEPPLVRLPLQWEFWEQLLDDAQVHSLQLGNKVDITDAEKAQSESWRARVRQVRLRLFTSNGCLVTSVS